MFEVIGIFFVIYLAVGVVALALLYTVDKEMRKAIGYVVVDKRWGELVAMLLLTWWCWPFPVLEYLTN